MGKVKRCDAPLPRSQPKGLIPHSWLGNTLKIDFVGADGMPQHASAAYVEQHPFGPVMKSSMGDLFAVSWDAIRYIELVEKY